MTTSLPAFGGGLGQRLQKGKFFEDFLCQAVLKRIIRPCIEKYNPDPDPESFKKNHFYTYKRRSQTKYTLLHSELEKRNM